MVGPSEISVLQLCLRAFLQDMSRVDVVAALSLPWSARQLALTPASFCNFGAALGQVLLKSKIRRFAWT